MIVKIGSFSKRHNSTKQPAANWGTTLADVELKEDCSMEEPIFRIGFSNWDPAYNYIYVPAWSRYYFVIDVTVRIGRIWEVSCRLDAAATYKADIQAARPFVLYADTSNTEIIDNRLPTKTTATTVINSAQFAPGLLTATGKIALSVVGDNTTSTYIVTNDQLRQILNFNDVSNTMSRQEIYGGVDYDYSQAEALPDGTEIETYIKIGEWIKTLVHSLRQNTVILMSGNNPLECLRSAIWYPWDIVGDGTPESIKLGVLDTLVTASPVVNKVRGGSVTVNIPWQASDWRRNAPYHQIYLYIPFVGTTQLSVSDLIGKTSLTVGWAMNKLTGEMNVQVTTNTGEIIGVYNAQTAVSIPVGVSNVTPRQVANAIISGAGAIASAVSGHMIGAAAMAAQSISAISPQITCIGGASGGAAIGLEMNVICYSVFHDTNVPPSNLSSSQGQPVSSEVTLSILSGYVQTQGASIQGANMSDAVRQELNAMCDNGIFLE